ncbi:MAG: glycosyltransferase family 2 protein [Deltaproteobacteria bacterium]|nr:glycosyltransferase family 2 protein [Deltaproteobacteria bacterium]
MNSTSSFDLTTIILTFNAGSTLPRCLESLTPLNSQICIIDSGSSDNTLELARKYTNQIVMSPLSDFSKQRNLGLDHVSAEWVLFIDSDEMLTPELTREICRILTMGVSSTIAGFAMKRHNQIFGHWMRFGGHQRDWQIRLMRRSRARYVNFVHEQVELRGELRRLRSPLLHYSTPDLQSYLAKLGFYAELEAKQLVASRKSPALLRLWTDPFIGWLRQYIFDLGFLDGRAGLQFALLSAFNRYCVLARWRELVKNP